MTYGYGDERDDRRTPPGSYGPGYPGGYDQGGADQGYDPFATQSTPRGYEPPAYGQPYSGQPEYGYSPPHESQPYQEQPYQEQPYQEPGYGQQPDYGYGQSHGQQPTGYGQQPTGYGQQPTGYGQSYEPPTYNPPPRHQEYPAPGYDQGTAHQGYQQRGYEQRGYEQPTSGYPRSDRGGHPDQGYDPAYAPRSAPPRGEYRPGNTGVYGRPRAVSTDTGGYGALPGPREAGMSGQYPRPSFESNTSTSQRYREPIPPPEPPRRRTGKVVGISIVVVALLAAAVGGGLWWANRSTANAGPAPSRAALAAIADRVKDPKPLTVAEVYGPNAMIAATNPAGKYKVLGSQLSADCGVAVTDALVALLKTAGCNQVVRGTLTSPNGTYVITAGIFNLKDSSAATQVYSDIMSNVTTGKGRFTGFATGGAGDVITQAQANLAWDSVGHYLVYCVIALADGKPIAKDDKATKDIIDDVVESYLGDKVLSTRATTAGPTGAGASPSTSK